MKLLNMKQKKKSGFLGMLLGTLVATILGNMLARKPKIAGQGVIREDARVISTDEGVIRTNQDF